MTAVADQRRSALPARPATPTTPTTPTTRPTARPSYARTIVSLVLGPLAVVAAQALPLTMVIERSTLTSVGIGIVLLALIDEAPDARAVVTATGLLLAPPSLIGESNGRPAILVLFVGALLSVTALRSSSLTWSARLLAAPTGLLVLYLVTRTGGGSERAAAVYTLIAALLLVFPLAIEGFAVDISRTVAATVGAGAASYLVTAVCGFSFTPFDIRGDLYSRPLFGFSEWAPFTVTSGGTGPLSLPRWVGFTGEPGLVALLCVVGIAVGWSLMRTTAGRVVFTGLNVVGLLVSQSTAGLVLFPVALGVAAALLPARDLGVRLRRWSVAGLAVLAGYAVSGPLLASKLDSNSASFSDRGLQYGSGGLTSVGVASRITFVASLSLDGVWVLLPVLALVVCWRRSRHVLPVATAIVFGLAMGMIAEPMPYQWGLYLVYVTLTVALAPPGDRARAAP